MAILVAMIVVGFLNLHAHQTEHSKEDVRVNFHFPHPNQLGSEDLTLNFLIVNKAISSIVLVETLAVEIASTSLATTRPETVPFAMPSWVAGRSAMESLAHPGQKVLHHTTQKPAHFLTEANENWTTNPPFADDGKLDVAYY